MSIARKELFTPVYVLLRATTVSDALSIANSTPYGLRGSVFDNNTRDLKRINNGLKYGMVAVNDFAIYYAVQIPFGGVKGSGYGRFAEEEGLRSVYAQKSVCRDRFLLMKTSIPPPLRLPLRDEARAWSFTKEVVEVGYGETSGRKAGGVRKLIGL